MNTDDFVDVIISNLKVIGMLQKSSKLCIRKGSLSIDNDDHLQAIRRWLNKDSRDNVLMHVRNTIHSSIKISKELISGSLKSDLRDWTLARLNDEMRACEMGLVNLKTTYMSDAMMVASLNVLIDRLKANYEEISKYNTVQELPI
jgi:hypothetical protein